jgi:deoxyribodipyrimidine photo-lyase
MQNSGGWQWTVGNGIDAAPYFRIFNPWTQQKTHDQDCTYIKKWIP